MNDALFCGLTEPEANTALGEFCCTPLTEQQQAELQADEGFDSPPASIEARGIVFANSTARQRTYTRSLDAMALVRAKMDELQAEEFANNLAKEFEDLPEIFDSPVLELIYLCLNADAPTQARAALEALGLGKEEKSDG